jgi:hypothetical protein
LTNRAACRSSGFLAESSNADPRLFDGLRFQQLFQLAVDQSPKSDVLEDRNKN